MTGWLIYDREGKARNRTFIRFWMEAAQRYGVTLLLKDREEPLSEPFPDFAVVRVMDPAFSFRLEAYGIPVFNPACVSEVCNDKWKTYRFASSLGIPFPQTEYILEPSLMAPHPFPYVLKACAGHGGTQVFLVETPAQEAAAKNALRGIPSVLQAVVSDRGRDVRVYVLGKRVLACMKRVSDTDFRSNFCLGGTAIPYTLSPYERDMVDAFLQALPFGLAGIDFIFDGGKAVFNEIEDVVGCRMLYSMTNVQPVELYLQYILEKLSKSGGAVL